ncbi:M56 family metallopeptidase [uncultured Allobaculum sp.]|uniref:M56 family metallopeptidase n=3 Tax=Erysipelotrichaceae TaxID=128827 RepID=UPI0025885A3C|nr:M56 family metallopeptidase [uncultured Allobaculum sp.]
MERRYIMLLSVYSVFMALLFCICLMAVLAVLLHNSSLASRIHPCLFMAVLCTYFFRMFLPCSFQLGVELPWNGLFPLIDHHLETVSFLGTNGFGWLSWIWLAGAAIAFVRYRRRYEKEQVLMDMVLDTAKQYAITDFIPDYCGPDFDLYISPSVPFSFVRLDHHPAIILPDVPMHPDEYEFIILHEVCHLCNEDALLKKLYLTLTIVYWWLPGLTRIRPVLELFSEIRVDRQITEQRTPLNRLNYSRTVLRFAAPSSRTFPHTNFVRLSAFSRSTSTRALESRIRVLIDTSQSEPKQPPAAVLWIPFACAFFSSLILISIYAI